MSYDFIKSEAERLNDRGYIEMAAMDDWFQSTFKQIQKRCPEARYLEKTDGDIGQIIYLPKAIPRVRKHLQNKRDDANVRLQNTNIALMVLSQGGLPSHHDSAR